MMITQKQTMLDEFKKSHILSTAKKMADNEEFISNFTLNIITNYVNELSTFFKVNEQKLNSFIKTLTTEEIKKKKNILFLQELNFIFDVPKLIKISNKKNEVDYVFLEKHFKKVEKKEYAEIKNTLKELEQKFEPIKKEKLSLNLSNFYNIGCFILNFLTNREIRIKIFYDLLKQELEINVQDVKPNTDKFENAFRQQFVLQKNKKTYYSSEVF